MNIKSISILGCGWLGFPLAKELKSRGIIVKGSTTSESKLKLLSENGIHPYHITLPLFSGDLSSFFEAEAIVIAFPPGLRNSTEDQYLKKIESLTSYIQNSKASLVIHIGTTSVYESANTKVSEKNTNETSVHFKAEKLIENACGKSKRFIAARCGGLMGYDRYPCKYIKTNSTVKGGNNGVNYIHRDDVIGILTKMISNEDLNGIFNLVAPVHPIRKSVYLNCAEKANINAPEFEVEETRFKIIDGEKLKKKLAYEFKYPNPLAFYYEFN